MVQLEARTFYDQYDRKLLSDYVFGNSRIEAAIRFTLTWIRPETLMVLDIGCGIGWSSWEIKRHYPKAKIISVDLSPRLTEISATLFRDEGIRFVTADITQYDDINPGTVDAVVMLDVYEHIHHTLRSQLHSFLDRVLSPLGTVIMTFPTVKHQTYLREHKPEGLQPVDEDVTRDDIALLAQDIHGRILHFEEVSIWAKEDYVHAVLTRHSFGKSKQDFGLIQLEDRKTRRTRVESALCLSVFPGGIIFSRKKGPAVCVATPRLEAYSETFIQAHIEQLPTTVHVLYGGHLPTHGDEGESLIPKYNLLKRLRFRLRQQLRGLSWDERAKHIVAIEQFLQYHQVQAVLAEYGLTGVEMMEVCQHLHIPLIVHFHGYDASHRDILTGPYGIRYPELFASAQAIIAVSHAMKTQLIRLGAPADKVHYNPYGVDMSLFAAAAPAENPPVFSAVGRFVNKKAPYLTLMAFSEVVKQVPEARLIMVGDGELLEPCQRLARVLGIVDAVDFRGICSHVEVAALMRTSRAFVQHSVQAFNGDSEGTPVAVLEASASGLPVVSTRHAGIPDVVIEGETGILVDEGDVDSMVEAMVLLAKDPQMASRMGKAGRHRVEEHFSMEKSISNLWKIIETVIEGRTNAPR